METHDHVNDELTLSGPWRECQCSMYHELMEVLQSARCLLHQRAGLWLSKLPTRDSTSPTVGHAANELDWS